MISLADICLQQSLEDRLELCRILRESIDRERRGKTPLPTNRGQSLLLMMEQILDIPFVPENRTPMASWARAMVAYELLREGYSTFETGAMLKRNHSTVSYMKTKMRDMFNYPDLYKDLINIWEQFQKRIQDDIQQGTD